MNNHPLTLPLPPLCPREAPLSLYSASPWNPTFLLIGMPPTMRQPCPGDSHLLGYREETHITLSGRGLMIPQMLSLPKRRPSSSNVSLSAVATMS